MVVYNYKICSLSIGEGRVRGQSQTGSKYLGSLHGASEESLAA